MRYELNKKSHFEDGERFVQAFGEDLVKLTTRSGLRVIQPLELLLRKRL